MGNTNAARRGRASLWALLTAMAVSLALLMGSAGVGTAHFGTGASGVTGNEKMVIANASSYGQALAQSRADWNRFSSNNNNRGVEIYASSSTTHPDTVRVAQYRRCGSDTAGYYQERGNLDLIGLNTCYGSKKATIVHEIGHGLTFDHPPATEYYRRNSIMYPCASCARTSRPMFHDARDYVNRWIN